MGSNIFRNINHSEAYLEILQSPHVNVRIVPLLTTFQMHCNRKSYENISHNRADLATAQSLQVNDYTGCNRRNGPDFGRVFLMLKYNEKPQNTYIQS